MFLSNKHLRNNGSELQLKNNEKDKDKIYICMDYRKKNSEKFIFLIYVKNHAWKEQFCWKI